MKKAILLCNAFFGYEETLRYEIEKYGYDCLLINSEPKFNLVDAMRNKINKQHYIHKTQKYIKETIKTVSECDLLIIVFSPKLSSQALSIFRKKFPKIRIVYYIWDSVANFPNVLDIASAADEVFSFDKTDCKRFGYKFLPLFYSESKDSKCKVVYDYSMVFSIYPKKITNYLKLKEALPRQLNGKKHIYCSKKMFYYYKLFYKNFRLIQRNEIAFNTLERENVYSIFKQSRVTIDCPLESQHGLTMRTFEALSLGIKIVTTNKDIMNYDFYSSDNIFVIDKSTKEIPLSFFKTPFNTSTCDISDYSISAFVSKLLEETNNN